MGARPGGPDWVVLRESYCRALEHGHLSRYRRRRWERAAEFAQWLGETSLLSLPMEQALALYRASGGARGSEFTGNPIEEIRESLDFLLYDTIKLEGRFDECAAAGGAYKLGGAGKEFVSYLLCLRNPALLAVWNRHSEQALRRLGIYPKTMGIGPMGVRYLDLLEALLPVRRDLGLPDFQAVDQFCYLVARTKAPPRW